MSDPENNDRTEAPSDTDDAAALREYGRQLAMDSLMRDVLEPGQASQDKVVPLADSAPRRILPIWISVAAACVLGLVAIAIFKFGGGSGANREIALDSRWTMLAAAGADYQILAPDRVRLQRGELRFTSSAPAKLSVETPHATAQANGTDFLIGHHLSPSTAPADQNPNQTDPMNRREMTRMLVLAGLVTMATDAGAIEAAAEEAAVAYPDELPEKTAVRANSQFALQLYKELSKQHEGENLFFSPYSISSALLMAAEGARGETASEMGKVLGFPNWLRRIGDDDQSIPWEMSGLHLGQKQLMARLNRGELTPEQKLLREREAALTKELEALKAKFTAMPKSERKRDNPEFQKLKAAGTAVAQELEAMREKIDTLELRVANALWGEKSYPFAEPWKKVVTGTYGTGAVQAADFLGNAENERARINAWVEEQTNGKIGNLLPAGSVDMETRLILANAVYFKADWDSPFDAEWTAESDFTLESGDAVKVPLMAQNAMNNVRYAAFNGDGSVFKTPTMVPSQGPKGKLYPEEDGFLMVEIPYRKGEVSMVVIAPTNPDGLGAVEEKLSTEGVRKWINAAQRREVHVRLPKFKAETGYALSETLQEMGMKSAFTSASKPGGADFSGLSGSADPANRPHIGQVAHKAFIEVNERGTEAAAATAAVEKTDSKITDLVPFTPIFSADRPFLYLVRDIESGTILFLGRMMDPTK